MTDKDGGPAFPQKEGRYDEGSYHLIGESGGMSLRDWFAGQALSQLIAESHKVTTVTREDVVGEAFKYADAMLAARENHGK